MIVSFDFFPVKEASQVVDVQNIKHITEKKRLIREVVEQITRDWNDQKESFYQQTGLDQCAEKGLQQPQDNNNAEQPKDDANFNHEDNDHFENQEYNENLEQPEDDDDEIFGEELERHMLSDEEL